ncbi:hypothetical protein ACLB2K_071398 [Fragaria x ananassa]
MANSKDSIACSVLMILIVIDISIVGAIDIDGWDYGHATFYGDVKGHGTEGGACGYEDLWAQGYGLETTALSSALFNNGQTCGACFEIMCAHDSKWCWPRSVIKVTATNFCPSSTGPQAWCNPPLKHFDLSMPMFLKIAKAPQAGIVPIRFRKIWCSKRGGIKFELQGNPNFLLVLVYNVGGVGDVVNVKIKGSNTDWWQMSRNWGQKWNVGGGLVGQSLSFQVTTSDGRTVWSENVAPANWGFGQTYEGRNF